MTRQNSGHNLYDLLHQEIFKTAFGGFLKDWIH